MTVQDVPIVVMRGGTSKGAFFKSNDVPPPGTQRDQLIARAMGSGDPRQIDGLGGADILTSKVAIVGRSGRTDADVDYTFGQVSIADTSIDWKPNCGNISSAVGVFAIEEGLVSPTEPTTVVRVFNTNTASILRIHVPVAEGRPLTEGNFAISSVPGTGAEIRLDFAATVGSETGKLLPTGSLIDQLEVPELARSIPVSIVDIAKAAVFVEAAELGLTGTEAPAEFTPDVLERFVWVQRAAAQLIGLDPAAGYPRPVVVAKPAGFVDFTTGRRIDESEVDLVGRWIYLPPPSIHKAFAATGAVCTAVAARLNGTVANRVSRVGADPDVLRLGHPSGVFPLRVSVAGEEVLEVSFSRTARRLFEGRVSIPM